MNKYSASPIIRECKPLSNRYLVSVRMSTTKIKVSNQKMTKDEGGETRALVSGNGEKTSE